MYYGVSRCPYAGSCPYAESLWDSSTLEQPAFNISWYIFWDLPSPYATQSQCYQFRSWISAVVVLSTTLIYEHPGALQQHVCRTKFKQFANLSSETLGSPVVEPPTDTCHSPTNVVPPTVATNTELPPGVTSGVGVDVSGAPGVAKSSLVRTSVDGVGNVLDVCSAPGAASSLVRTGVDAIIAEEQDLNVGGPGDDRSPSNGRTQGVTG